MRKAPPSLNLEDFRAELIARIDHLAALEQSGPVDMGDPIDNECDQDTLFHELRVLRTALDALENGR